MKTLFKTLAPLLVIALAIAIVVYLLRTRQEPEIITPAAAIPPVEVVVVELGEQRPRITTNGTLRPRHTLNLRSEVTGTVQTLSPEFEPGTTVTAGTVLLTLEVEDFEATVAARRAEVAEAHLLLAEEIARGAQAEREWRRLGRDEEPTELTLRVPQRRRAEARLASAEASLAAAKRDLGRTQLAAPFDGIIAERRVAPGEILQSPGSVVGRLVATGRPEVRLTLPFAQLHLLSIPGGEVELRSGTGPTLRGNITTLVPELEGATRLAELIVELDPTSPSGLPFGTFLNAHLIGKPIPQAASLPRAVLRSENTVWVVTPDNRVETRSVRVIHRTATEILISDGLSRGDRVVRSPLPFFTEGMRVQIMDDNNANSSTVP